MIDNKINKTIKNSSTACSSSRSKNMNLVVQIGKKIIKKLYYILVWSSKGRSAGYF